MKGNYYQRTAIYKRRENALLGERLQVDISNTLYDVCAALVNNAGNNYDELEFRCLSGLGIEPPFARNEIGKIKPEERVKQLYVATEAHYDQKNKVIAKKVLPVFKDIMAERGATIEQVVVPVTDEVHNAYVECNLKKTIDNQGREVVKEMEKFITLSVIDQEWKEHLRDMDDLKQNVQNASLEQKDPLLIYKFEAVEMFQRFLNRVNYDTASFLMKAYVPDTNAPTQPIKKVDAPKVRASKDDIAGIVGGLSQRVAEDEYNTNAPEQVEKAAPRQVIKIADRNQRVNVQYRDGRVEKDVKYKKVENDVESGICVVIG